MVRQDSGIDFHTHSTASDGTSSPSELVADAVCEGLGMVALTDHDTLAGLDEFVGACSRADLQGIRGLEVSSHFGGRRLHLLALGFPAAGQPRLAAFLREVRLRRVERNREMVRRLRGLRIAVELADLEALAPGEIVARPHFARFLVDRGHAEDVPAAFTRFIGENAPAYVPKERFGPEQVIQTIHSAGGLVLAAHPHTLSSSPEEVVGPLTELADMGLDGFEAYHPDVAPRLARAIRGIARTRGLLVSGGSDYHGGNKRNLLGRGHGGRRLVAGDLWELVGELLKDS